MSTRGVKLSHPKGVKVIKMQTTKLIIGLEVHIELKTKSKMFCGCSADHFAKPPNTLTCPTCLGLPGALPVPNKKAIEWTILLGLSLGGEIPKISWFDRKNYFYPDLPKGYQISQYQHPFSVKGKLTLDSGKIINITRVHLEEDTAKLLHETINGEKVTLIDFNRSGLPLVEIVSEPEINSSDEAKQYLEKIRQIVRYLGISDAEMEKGSMRCEPNVNLEIRDNDKIFYTPITELKNINSFRFAKKAVDFEVKRQFEEFREKRTEKSKGNKQTRGWDENKGITVPQRQKEEANDYRYFPEPDIPPFEFTQKELSIFNDQLSKIELPQEKKKRFVKKYGLSDYQAKILTEDKETADYYEKTVMVGEIREIREIGEIEIANTIINKRAPENLDPEKLFEWILSSKTTSGKTEEEIDELIDKLLSEHQGVVESYKKGKIQSLGTIVGLVKKLIGEIVPIERISSRIK